MSETVLTSGDFTESAEPFRLFAPMARRRHQERAQRSERAGAGDRRRGRHARRPDGAAQGLRRAGLCLLHQFRERQGPRDPVLDEGRDVLSLEIAAPAGADTRTGRDRQRRRSRRLFQDAPARQPDRRLGLEAVAAAGKPFRAGKGGGGIHGEICDRRNTAAQALVGFSARAAVDRVLARPAVPPARPHRVQPRGWRGWEKTRLYP